MPSYNKAVVIGHLGADPDIRTFDNGDKVANISVATSEKWSDKTTGEVKEKTEWHRVVIFGKLVDVVQKYCKKGDAVMCEGKMETRSWEQDGQKKYATEIVLRGFNSQFLMLGGKTSEASPATQNPVQSQDEQEDEIPF